MKECIRKEKHKKNNRFSNKFKENEVTSNLKNYKNRQFLNVDFYHGLG